MLVNKQEVNNTADGTTELFELESEYIAGSVLVLEIDSAGNVVKIDADELGTSFIQISPAPVGTSSLLIMYKAEDPNIVDVNSIIPGLAPWDSKRIVKLIEVIANLQEAVSGLEGHLANRLSKEEFNSWAAVIEKRVKENSAQL